METSEVLLVNFAGVVFAGVISWLAALWVHRRQYKWAAEVEQSIKRLHRLSELALKMISVWSNYAKLVQELGKLAESAVDGWVQVPETNVDVINSDARARESYVETVTAITEMGALVDTINDRGLHVAYKEYLIKWIRFSDSVFGLEELADFMEATKPLLVAIYRLIEKQHKT